MISKHHFVWWGLGCLVVVGCASPGPQAFPFGVRRIPDGDRSAVFEAARKALVELGFTIKYADPTTGRITTQPTTETDRPALSRKRVRISAESALRRVIQMRVGETKESVNVYCQVAIQVRETESHRIMQPDLVASDRPGETAIDRGAGATTEQNTVWRTIDRDKMLERRILEIVLEQAGSGSNAPDSEPNTP